jgi:hypothetical protein
VTAPKPVTMAEAKAVWASMPNPSSRKVSQRFADTGRKVSYKTINVWRKSKWGESPEAAAKKIEKAATEGKAKIDNAAAVATGNPAATSEDVKKKQDEEGGNDGGLAGATIGDVSESTIREVLLLARAVAVEIRKRAKEEALTPHLVAKAINDLAGGMATALEGARILPSVRESSMKTVTGTVIEERGFTHPSLSAAQENAAIEVKRLTNDTAEPATV